MTATSLPETRQAAAKAPASRIIRDPHSGRWYRQQLVPVQVPATRWEPQLVTRAVLEPQTTTATLPVPQNLFVPRTDYVWQVRTRGRLNPFRPVRYLYEYVPVTHWVPASQAVSVPIATQQWTTRHQTAQMYRPVQTVETKLQLVQTEIPPPPAAVPSGAGGTTQGASGQVSPRIAQPRAWINYPRLAGNYQAKVTASNGQATSSSTLRPIENSQITPTYTRSADRDSMQAGMSATVLR